jgi:hypothetical protein
MISFEQRFGRKKNLINLGPRRHPGVPGQVTVLPGGTAARQQEYLRSRILSRNLESVSEIFNYLFSRDITY